MRSVQDAIRLAFLLNGFALFVCLMIMRRACGVIWLGRVNYLSMRHLVSQHPNLGFAIPAPKQLREGFVWGMIA